ncbi:Arc family DNA-binding protein [Brucella pseudogrignonensis]|uniref:Arc family DNA-binding protein n=1 Tax=Brucella pseudogrignonensis TaxID=419475 RepID=UPI0028B7AABE|nr:Arc family DNA-binding protein [Brucella pseudogrignonensis]MDT6941420.1 Arc family DNA-binding protein [Brucella pseudogrignonensis]
MLIYPSHDLLSCRILRHMCVMAKDDLLFRLRIPEEIKQQIEVAAAENCRSINAEIIHRLQTTLEFDEDVGSENTHADERSSDRNADSRIGLDTNGIPLSVQKALLHLNNLVHKSNLEDISIEMDIGMLKNSRTPEQREDDFRRILSTYQAMREVEDE